MSEVNEVPVGEEEDRQLENALIEYADSMDDDKREAFMNRVQNDKEFYFTIGKALSEMAMLIAGAAVIDEEAEFGKMRKRILFEARKDTPEVKTMRLYYLNNRHAVEMDAVLETESDKARFEERLRLFLEDYRQHHPDAA